MRTTVAVLLALSLLTSFCLPALAEEEDRRIITITACLQDVELCAEDWIGTDRTRTALAALAVEEFRLVYGESDALCRVCAEGIDSDRVYTAMDPDGLLYVLYFGSGGYGLVTYHPLTLLLGITMDYDAGQGMEEVLQSMVGSGRLTQYDAVPQEDIVSFLHDMAEQEDIPSFLRQVAAPVID